MSELPQILHHFVQKNHTVISMAVSINKLHLISKYSFFLRRGRKLGSYCQSASWKTALKHTTLYTRNYYKYNKKFIIIFDSRTFTRYAELFETHHTEEKQRELYGKFYLTKLNSINTEFSGITLLLDNTLHNKKCINCLSPIITTTYIKSTPHNHRKSDRIYFLSQAEIMFQYFTSIISLNHTHPLLASHAAFLFSFQVLLPTHKKKNVILK